MLAAKSQLNSDFAAAIVFTLEWPHSSGHFLWILVEKMPASMLTSWISQVTPEIHFLSQNTNYENAVGVRHVEDNMRAVFVAFQSGC